MNPATTLAVSALRAADRVSPPLAGRLALPLFRQVRPVLPLRASDRAVHEEASRETTTVRGREVVTYSWGHGPETVLVMEIPDGAEASARLGRGFSARAGATQRLFIDPRQLQLFDPATTLAIPRPPL